MRAAAADREVSDEGIVYGDLSGSEQLAGYQKAGNFTYSDCSLCRMRDPVQHFAGKGNSGCADPGGNRSSVSGIGICKPWCDRCGRWLYPVALGTLLDTEIYIQMLCIGFFLAAFWSGILLVISKKSRDTEIPLMPFLLAGYIGGVLI